MKSSGQSTRPRNLFIVAGEASADLHAARMFREFKELDPTVRCTGVGGTHLKAEGMQTIVDAEKLNAFGITDWLDRVGEILSGYRRLKRFIHSEPIDCAVLLDLPDLNLALAKHLKFQGVPIVYYISPQIWAWRKYRINKIKRLVDRMLVVFPFEKEFYESYAVNVQFVGHPLIETVEARNIFRSQEQLSVEPKIAVLPGSRVTEIKHHVPILRDVFWNLISKFPKASFRVPIAPTLKPQHVREVFQGLPVEFSDCAEEVVKWSDVAMVASGTAALETALTLTPLCLFYKVNLSTAWLFKLISGYKGLFGMPNLLLGRELIPELIQDRATGMAIAEETIKLIQNEQYRRAQISAFERCRELLGTTGASSRAARSVYDAMTKVQSPALSGIPLAESPAHS